MSNKIDYDLNIFRLEQYVGVDENYKPIYEYLDPWYLHIYAVNGAGHYEVSPAYELTPEESRSLKLGMGYFDEDDNWYGLEGFMRDYLWEIPTRFWDIFNALPEEEN